MKYRTFLILVLRFCVFALCASAQVSTATVYAAVTGSTGAVIPCACDTLNHIDTGATVTCQTNEVGTAVFDFLRIGCSTLAIEAQGLRPVDGQHLELAEGRASGRKSPCRRVSVETQLSRR